MKMEELLTKTKEQLQSLLDSNRAKLRELRFKDSNKQLKNVKEIKAHRVQIAQILTAINKKK